MNPLQPHRSALVVLSGGQDSAMCLHWAKDIVGTVHALTFAYGQRHARELDAAKAIARIVGVASHEILDLGSQILMGTSPLTDHSQPLETYDSYQQMEQIIGSRVEKTFVPMRNALFLTIAANRAAVLGCDVIVTGVCQADNANYPDCRVPFIEAQQLTIAEALGPTAPKISICTPLMNMSKAGSVKWANQSGWYTSLAFTHTAYDGACPPGQDHASVLRAQGFLEAGLPDPLIVRCWAAGMMDLPKTPNYEDVTLCSVVADNINAMWAEHFSEGASA